MKEEISKLVQANKITYKNQPARVISDYRREQQTTKDYNGRQLFELLQNADDAQSQEVQIIFDSREGYLQISNKGEEFDIKGVRSLLLSDFSSKNKKEYIGNKGLGFRSILNWASSVQVSTHKFCLKFSEEIAKTELEKIFPGFMGLEELLEERELEKDKYPFPVLSLPEIIDDQQPSHSWITEIKIWFPKDQPSIPAAIKKQLDGIVPEILLFLNHTRRINIIQNDVATKIECIHENLENHVKKTVGDRSWKIFDTEDQLLPNTKSFYRIKVALREDLSDTYRKLFTYFPTQVNFNLPCLVHGTFELNSSRNHLVNSPFNKTILNKLSAFLLDISNELAKEKVDWRPWRLLSPISYESESEQIKAFYAILTSEKEKRPIYPCIDGRYRRKESTVFYSKEFSNWMVSHEFFEIFKELLLVDKEFNLSEIGQIGRYPKENLQSKIDMVSKSDSLSIENRADLIDFFIGSSPFDFQERNQKYSLLISRTGKVISNSTVAFTPPVEDGVALEKPEYVEFEFIDIQLFQLLQRRYKEAIENKDRDEKIFARKFKRFFDGFVNIQPYDSNTIISRIISETRAYLNKTSDSENKKKIVRQMVQALRANYSVLESKADRFSDPCPLISKNGTIVDSGNLFFDDSFPSGKVLADCFSLHLKDDNLLAQVDFWGIQDISLPELEDFFSWLHVKRRIGLEEKSFTVSQYLNGDSYFSYSLKGALIPSYASGFEFQGKVVGPDIELFKGITFYQLCIYLNHDEQFKNHLNSYLHKTIYLYSHSRTPIPGTPSHVKYQIQKYLNLSNYLIDYQDINFINDENIDYDNFLLKKYNIQKWNVTECLRLIGAKSSFDELSQVAVQKIIDKCPEYDPDGKLAQKIYKLAFANFKKNETGLDLVNNPGTLLFCRKGKIGSYVSPQSAYYSDNNVLPEIIRDRYSVLPIPKRQGADQVTRFFGVRNFTEVKLEIVSDSLQIHPLNEQFKSWYKQVFIYGLANRLISIKTTDNKRTESNAFKNINLILVRSLRYSLDGEEHHLSENECINSDNNFYIKPAIGASVEALRSDNYFCDSFAEALCIHLGVVDHKLFTSVFRNPLEVSRHELESEGHTDLIEEAKSLLGISPSEFEFWLNVAKRKNIPFPADIISSEELRDWIKLSFDVEIDKAILKSDYQYINNKDTFDLYKSLASQLDLLGAEMLDFPGSDLQLDKIHLKALEALILDYEKVFEKNLWTQLNQKSQAEKEQFIEKKVQYLNLGQNGFKEFTEDNKFNFAPNYLDYFEALIFQLFEVKLDKHTSIQNISPTNCYSDLFKELGISIEELSQKEKSLANFSGFEEYFRAIAKPLLSEESLVQNEKIDSLDLVVLVNNPPVTSVGLVLPTTSHVVSSSVVSEQQNQQKRVSGKKAEKLVFNVLVKKYGEENVKWVSGNSDRLDATDSLHYDLRYKKNNEWYFVEVKSFANDCFYISQDELNFAKSNGIQSEIALVKDSSVFLLNNFFGLDDTESFYDNKRFKVKITNYQIFTKLSDPENIR